MFRSYLTPAAAAAAAAHDHLVGLLALLAGAALGLAPRRHRVATARALALTTAERVVDRVHGHAAHVGALALPPVAAGLAHLHQRCLGVADRADRGAAVDGHAAHLRGREPKGRELAFLRHELDRGAGPATDLAAGTGLQLDVVHRGPDRDVAERERVARADLGAVAALEQVADLHLRGGEDVPLLAVEVVEQREASVAVGVVLDGRDLRRHAVLVAPEVDGAVLLLVPTAAV